MDIAAAWRRIQHLVRPARVSAPPNETGAIQRYQVRPNDWEVREVSSAQHYGFASSPLPGCDVVLVNVAGDNGNGVAVATNDQRHRPRNMAAGAVRIYNNAGSYVHVEAGRITIVAGTDVTVIAPALKVQGNVEATGDVTAGGISLRNHRHQNTQPGSGQSGTPIA